VAGLFFLAPLQCHVDKWTYTLEELALGRSIPWGWALNPPPGGGLMYPCAMDWGYEATNDERFDA
jgi:hypothetical protein